MRRSSILLLAAFLPAAESLRFSSSLLQVASSAPRVRCACAAEVPEDEPALPDNLDQLTLAVRGTVRSAVLSGIRGLRVEACVPTLDVADRAYDPAVLARFCLEISHTLLELGTGSVRVLLPGLTAATEARQLLEAPGPVVFDSEAQERLEIGSLTMCSPPSKREGEERPGIILLAGLARSQQTEGSGVGADGDGSLAAARAWLRLACSNTVCACSSDEHLDQYPAC